MWIIVRVRLIYEVLPGNITENCVAIEYELSRRLHYHIDTLLPCWRHGEPCSWNTIKFSFKEQKKDLPTKSRNHFFEQILFKLADNVYNSKNGIPLLLFLFKMKTKEDICI
jgi:hypothetical protein